MADTSKTIIHCCVEKDIYDMLITHCNATGQTKTTAIKRAIKAYCQPVVDQEMKVMEAENKTDDK